MRSVCSLRSDFSTASSICAAVWRAMPPASRNQLIGPRPAILVASTTLSRAPGREANQLPMIRSVEPCVSGLGGTAYISAVSKKLTPRSSAKSICAWPSASVFCWPQVMVPRHTRETCRPVRPSSEYCMARP
jgi:hypothetical protein